MVDARYRRCQYTSPEWSVSPSWNGIQVSIEWWKTHSVCTCTYLWWKLLANLKEFWWSIHWYFSIQSLLLKMVCLFLSVIKFTREILPWVIMIVSWLSFDSCIYVLTLTLKKNKHVLLQVSKLLKRKCYNKDTCSARHLQSKYWKQINYFSKWSDGSIATCLWTVQQWKNFHASIYL